ncbi:unnamed protein product [Callosobruchus maculatus]|uniref:Uncharacterized protein n=1 Tax=Callosobruchus maculatus TaxID=64391 RepID=A0A653CS45_CALMS|nr:unnamed protein product [Callosobruchus maculatus]VEN50107.1 unnamed protein product [Callosobruchus maculatus]
MGEKICHSDFLNEIFILCTGRREYYLHYTSRISGQFTNRCLLELLQNLSNYQEAKKNIHL